jgi:hypothetical protein
MTKLANGWLWNKNKNRLKAMDTCLEVTFDVRHFCANECKERCKWTLGKGIGCRYNLWGIDF